MLRIGRTALVWAVALFMAIDPATACWRARCRPSFCSPPPCCPPPCCSPCVTYSVSDCGCDGGNGVATDIVPSDQNTLPSPEPAPAPSPAPRPAPRPAPGRSQMPVQPAEPAPSFEPPSDAPGLPSDEPPASPPLPDDTTPLRDEPPADMPDEPALPEEPAEKKEEGIDDIFDTEPKKSAAKRPEAGEENKAQESELEGLFKDPEDASRSASTQPARQTEELPAPSVTAADQNPMRVWNDNTGNFSVRARLVSVGTDHVRLLKDTGKYTTVPIQRLSHADLAFVRQQAPRVIASK